MKQRLEALSEISASDRDKLIYRTKYGLDDGILRSFEETGRMFNLTGEGIRLIVRRIDDLIS